MADRMPSGKKHFAVSDVTDTLDGDWKTEREKARNEEVEKEIALAKKQKEEAINEITEYNKTVTTISKAVQNIKLHGNKVVVKLFKHNPYSESGFYKPIHVLVDENNSGKYKAIPSRYQFLPKGVIQVVSDNCSESFKSVYKVGDVVDIINGISLEEQALVPNKTSEVVFSSVYDTEYFLLNENMIEKGFKDNLGYKITLE